jgi:Leucine-rich repeat (LRR) protein
MKKMIFICCFWFSGGAISYAQQDSLLSEVVLARQPIYNQIGRAFKEYDKVYRLALKSTGGYHGKVDAVHYRIDSLVNLQYFYCINEALTNLPMSFGKLCKMQQIYLSGNLFAMIPDTIFSLSYLKRLDMRGNQLTYIPDKISRLKELEYLYLHDNRELDRLPLEALSKLRRLKVLNLRHTKVPREQIQRLEKLLPNTKIEY